MENKGRFITFEGLDGSGKSTQARLLKERILMETGTFCYDTCEPSNGPIGGLIRQFLSGRMKADEKTLATLFASDRLDHLLNETNGICSKINNGINVICDRYILSNYAYQGGSTSLEWVMSLNEAAVNILKPDYHIFIDVEPAVALARVEEGRFDKELYETKEHLTKVRAAYLSLIHKLYGKEKILVVNGSQTVEKIADDIWHQISKLF